MLKVTRCKFVHNLPCEQVSNRLTELEAENDKLREMMYERAHKHAIHHMTEDELRITAANVMDENGKLREVVRDYERCSVHTDCAKCEYDGKLSKHCPYSPCFPDTDELRELGIEVEE